MSFVGRVFSNRYEIEREVAQGGMAEVYLARDQLLDRPVALKALFPEYAREPSFVERFRREAQAAANLNHPNIVSIYDWGQESGTYFIVMEYVEGRSLRDLIRSEGPLDGDHAAEITAEIAAALGFAHRNGVVHRDVKPGNVLMPQSGTVKVTDFGIARAGASDGLTQTGSVMGTATYFSPEQAQGLPVDGRSDVYSLGVVLYEMVTGVVPFTGDSPVAVAYKHVREEPLPPCQRNPEVAPDLEKIILTAMAKDPDHRYQSAEDMREDLLRFRRGRPLAAAPLTALVAEVPTTTAVAAGGTSAIAGAATIANPAVPVDERGRQTSGPQYPRRRVSPWLVTLLTLLVLAGIVALILWLSSRNSAQAEKIKVPNVVGKTVDVATRELNTVHLSPNVQQVASNAPIGTVIDQNPKAGASVSKSSTVTLKVSSGLAPVKLPDVTGQPVNTAKQTLAALHLQVVVDDAVESRDVPKGNVVSTNPPANQTVPAGSVVHLVPSSGVTVPNVINVPQDQAAKTLQDAGFNVQVFTEASNTVQSGNVTRTDPAPNTTLSAGATVKMFVSTGANTVAVPDERGQTRASAIADLQAKGFQARVLERASSPGNAGLVIDQDPKPGTQAAPGSTVVLTVGAAPSTTTSSASTTSTT
jgi:beta-lactam-binding protein with PASTA domain/tRNA A-37 threonylcarbamoyl transferase component Bud32